MNLSSSIVCPMAACKKCGECVRQSTYDRYRRGLYPLNPQKQAQVLGVFQRYGVDPSVGFDRYQIEDVLVEPKAEKES